MSKFELFGVFDLTQWPTSTIKSGIFYRTVVDKMNRQLIIGTIGLQYLVTNVENGE